MVVYGITPPPSLYAVLFWSLFSLQLLESVDAEWQTL